MEIARIEHVSDAEQKGGKRENMERLLIVDDLEDYLRSLERALSGEWQILLARSMEEAQAQLNTQTVDIALIDVRLSESEPHNQDGVILLKWLREHYPNLPVVMMSAYRDFDAAVEALNVGANHFLKKPIDLRELKQLLRSLSKSAQREDQTGR